MKYLSTILVLLGTSATMVASSPAPRPVAVANPAQPSVNVAANDGSTGIKAADNALEAVELAQAGDPGAVTSGVIFSSINAKFAASANPATSTTPAASPAQSTSSVKAAGGKKAGGKKAAGAKKGAGGNKAGKI